MYYRVVAGPEVRVTNVSQITSVLADDGIPKSINGKYDSKLKYSKFIFREFELPCFCVYDLVHRPTLLPELRYNLKMMVDMSEVEIHQLSRQVRELRLASSMKLIKLLENIFIIFLNIYGFSSSF